MGRNVHVVKDESRWAVKKEGTSKSVSKHGTQEHARKAAVKIVDRDSYGHDPHPPRDKKH